MKRKTLVFLQPFRIKNPTPEKQTEFMIRENVNEVECADLGKIYNNQDLFGKEISAFINTEVERYCPEWIIAEGECATAALKLKSQKKILLNPQVRADVLTEVSEFDIQHTFGFFDERHERDYERFQSVFPHAVWFPVDDNLALFTIKETVQEIIKTGEW